MPGKYRFLSQDLLSGAWLATNLPLSNVSITRELNGPGSLSAAITPRYLRVQADSLRPARTAIYVERDGVLVWGGIIWSCTPEKETYTLEASGFSSYLRRRHDLHGNANARGPWTYADPCKVYRDVWAYAQEQSDGNLGIVVDGTTSSAKVGTPTEPLKLNWWEARNLGEFVQELSSADDGFDYTDAVAWANHSATSGIAVRRIRLGYPRLGRRRTDISFRTGVNISDSPPVAYAGDNYAQVLIGLGAGEGSARIRSIEAIRNGYPRLEHVEQQPGMTGTDQLAKFLRTERAARTVMESIPSITVLDHPAAPAWGYSVGDEALVGIRDSWTDLELWCRIVSYTVTPESDQGETTTLELARADSFHYGAPA